MDLNREQQARVLESIAALDVNDEQWWTGDGLPRVDAVASLAGVSGLTRSQITELAPDFSRTTPTPDPVSTPDPEPQEVIPLDPEFPDAPQENAAEASDVGDLERLNEELAAADHDVREANKMLDEAQRRAAKANAARDLIMASRAKLVDPNENMKTIQDHLQQQRRRRLAAVEQKVATLKELGLESKDMVGMGQSQLDKVLARRKGHGSQTPGFRSQG